MLQAADKLSRNPPEAAIMVPLWDETKELVKVKLDSRNLNCQMHMFVYCVEFLWVWSDGSYEYLTIRLPPLPISTTSAVKLWEVMTGHKLCRPVWEFAVFLLGIARRGFDYGCTDMASGNSKLNIHKLRLAKYKEWLVAVFPCMNHQQFLGLIDVEICLWTPTWMSDFYFCCKFPNLGAHRLRIIVTVRPWLESNCEVRYGATTVADNLFAEELSEFVMRWERRRREKKNNAEPEHNKVPLRSRQLERFFQLTGGGYSLTSQKILIYSAEPFTKESWKKRLDEVANVIIDLCYSRVQQVPSSGKWDKTSVAVEQQMVNNLCNMQEGLLKRSCNKLDFTWQDCDDTSSFDEGSAVQYAATASKAASRMSKHLSSVDDKVYVYARGVLGEVALFLILVHMDYSASSTKYEHGKPTGLMQMANDRRSPLYEGMCYLSFLLSGRSPRVRLIYGARGCPNVKTWWENHPADVDFLRRGAQMMLAALQRRQRDVFAGPEVQLMITSDPLMPAAEQMSIWTSYLELPPFRLKEGFEARYRLKLETEGEGVKGTPEHKEAMLAIMKLDALPFSVCSCAIKWSVFKVEAVHAVHRNIAKQSHTVIHMVALAGRSLNASGRQQAGVEREREATVEKPCPQVQVVTHGAVDEEKNTASSHLRSNCIIGRGFGK